MMPITSTSPATDRNASDVLPEQNQWIQSSLGDDERLPLSGDPSSAGYRIWQGFMTARLMVAILLLVLQALGMYFLRETPPWLFLLCVIYVIATLGTRLGIAPIQPGQSFERYWLITLGLDLLVYFLLIWFGHADIANFIPLLALPSTISAVLGTRRITLLTVILSSLLIGLAIWRYERTHIDDNQILRYAVIALYMLAMFLVVSVLQRMAKNYGVQQSQSSANRKLLRLQNRIQDMVVQSVPDGVLVVSGSGRLRAINQTAQQMLSMPPSLPVIGRPINTIAQMLPLQHLIHQSFTDNEGFSSEIFLFSSGDHSTHLMVQARLSPALPTRPDDEPLCLLYLQDMRELQDQVRTEKLAAMGRMSAAVAHEIRNPLAAIGQAAQLLDEELNQPLQKRLNNMVLDNVQRLGRIVDDVLDIARMQQHPSETTPTLELDAQVHQLCKEWQEQHPSNAHPIRLALCAPAAQVQFEPEHLRRIMVNLLGNAWQHAQPGSDVHVIVSSQLQNDKVRLQIWSSGPPLPPQVQGRLFEPFTAGPSRSTGLGLYICRELCQRHRADIYYQRLFAEVSANAFLPKYMEQEGNAFFVLMPVMNITSHNPSSSPSTFAKDS